METAIHITCSSDDMPIEIIKALQEENPEIVYKIKNRWDTASSLTDMNIEIIKT